MSEGPEVRELPTVWHDFDPEGPALEALRRLLAGMDDVQALALECASCKGRNKRPRLEKLQTQLAESMAVAERLLYEVHTASVDQRLAEASG